MSGKGGESAAYGQRHRVTELRYRKQDKVLAVTFDDGKSFDLPAEYLRVESPSAEVKGHSPDEKKTVAEKCHVGIIGIEPVGNYAVKIGFDDLHDTGIFSWDYLYFLGENQDRIWQDYLADLERQGLSREPKRR